MTFANTLKYVFMATSANFGNMFSMAGASLFLPFLPLLPKQILLTNLMTDFPEMTIATDSVDCEMVEQPRHWDIRFIRNFMLTFGFVSSVFDYRFSACCCSFCTPRRISSDRLVPGVGAERVADHAGDPHPEAVLPEPAQPLPGAGHPSSRVGDAAAALLAVRRCSASSRCRCRCWHSRRDYGAVHSGVGTGSACSTSTGDGMRGYGSCTPAVFARSHAPIRQNVIQTSSSRPPRATEAQVDFADHRARFIHDRTGAGWSCRPATAPLNHQTIPTTGRPAGLTRSDTDVPQRCAGRHRVGRQAFRRSSTTRSQIALATEGWQVVSSTVLPCSGQVRSTALRGVLPPSSASVGRRTRRSAVGQQRAPGRLSP
jgi:hypothetical protein